MVVFNLVFAIVAVLGHRLREAGMEQETLATELKRVRLEADDILRNIRSGVLTVDGLGRLAFINPTAQRLLDLDGGGPGRACRCSTSSRPAPRSSGPRWWRGSGTGGRSAGARGW